MWERGLLNMKFKGISSVVLSAVVSSTFVNSSISVKGFEGGLYL